MEAPHLLSWSPMCSSYSVGQFNEKYYIVLPVCGDASCNLHCMQFQPYLVVSFLLVNWAFFFPLSDMLHSRWSAFAQTVYGATSVLTRPSLLAPCSAETALLAPCSAETVLLGDGPCQNVDAER